MSDLIYKKIQDNDWWIADKIDDLKLMMDEIKKFSF